MKQDKQSQKIKILNCLMKFDDFLTRYTLEDYSGSRRVASRINELRKEGYLIEGEFMNWPVFGYKLVETEEGYTECNCGGKCDCGIVV